MDKRRLTMWLVGPLLGVALLLSARSGWAQCYECFCNTTGTTGAACTSNVNLATSFCTTTNTGCNGFGQISTTACTALPFSNCATLITPPPPAKAPAPALGSWQLALMTILLAGAGWRLARRRTT